METSVIRQHPEGWEGLHPLVQKVLAVILADVWEPAGDAPTGWYKSQLPSLSEIDALKGECHDAWSFLAATYIGKGLAPYEDLCRLAGELLDDPRTCGMARLSAMAVSDDRFFGPEEKGFTNNTLRPERIEELAGHVAVAEDWIKATGVDPKIEFWKDRLEEATAKKSA